MGRTISYPPLGKSKVTDKPVKKREEKKEEEDDFAKSAFVGYVTDNALLGSMAGGSLLGGIIGEMLND